MDQHTQKSVQIIKWINIITSVAIVAFGVAGTIFLAINHILAGRFFMIFSPLFMVLFGVILFATEFNIDVILEKVGFLRSLLGRGIFNIFLSSQVFYYFSCGTANPLLGWVFGMTLFTLGIFYIILQFWKGNAYAQQMHNRLQK